ncbi:hypothetical protein AVEN_155281-1 [Araneus ventricosus]|uniref:Uncharacterized protein n=1 Tax=Araneus ventricosus TaxID=182803 RepID=A0A4Y2D7Q2_ARAVE|nr:hypothetical protein AVEN_155281-1 [Araneus ventricosus]
MPFDKLATLNYLHRAAAKKKVSGLNQIARTLLIDQQLYEEHTETIFSLLLAPRPSHPDFYFFLSPGSKKDTNEAVRGEGVLLYQMASRKNLGTKRRIDGNKQRNKAPEENGTDMHRIRIPRIFVDEDFQSGQERHVYVSFVGCLIGKKLRKFLKNIVESIEN